MKIRIEDQARIEAALAAAQTRATARTVSHADLVRLADRAERRLAELDLPKRVRPGAVWEFSEGGITGVANAYGAHQRASTHVKLVRGATGWFLTEAERLDFWTGTPGYSRLTLTKEQAKDAAERFVAAIGAKAEVRVELR